GPAFEGANIEKGLGGIKGAIARVTFNTGKLAFETIGNQPPIGICGSGLVDLVAILVSEGIIDETGAFCHNSQSQLANHLDADRFMLLNDIYLTQKDVRQFQLAKSAICAGIETLLNAANVDVDAVNKVFVAGGFGFYLNLDNALKIGLLPKVFHGRIISVGNTSGLGAAMCLLNPEKIKQVQELALKVQTIDLMTKEFGFTERFIENMMFSI
ncbi:MAG: ASKHA domain-containing protein, partial [Candidatus Izemoplasmatales bacterium]|nr:ASKHA domain-containing protein [Candidatus Izemoplasmatales bacterium]